MPQKMKLLVEESHNARRGSIGALAHQQTAVLLSVLGSRISRGATAYYKSTWNLGTVEWRLLMTLKSISSLNVSELSQAADVDKAATSRGLVLLEEDGLVLIEQTRSRGRAAIARLTGKGQELAHELVQISRNREKRLFESFTAAEKKCLNALLLRLADAIETDDWKY